ncbi:MAG: sensor histidine kinase [Spirochaetota bacterium]
MTETAVDRAEIERLRATCEALQQEIARSLRDKQDLIEIRNDLDRDLARFRVIQRYSRTALSAESTARFCETTVESIVEAFEFECAAVLVYDADSRSLRPACRFGFEAPMQVPRIDARWIDQVDLGRRADALVVNDARHEWPGSSLAQVIVCAFSGIDGEPEGALLGGVGEAKRVFFGPITAKLIPTFTVFTQQMSALLHNLEARNRMRNLNAELEQEIAERERAEDELRRAHDELEQRVAERTAELSAANRAKSRFLANMSHELRTPMNAVIGFAEMILDGIYGDASAEIRDVVGEIQQSGEHLLGLINDVLDITKIESGRMELRTAEGDLGECIRAAVSRLEPLARENAIELSTAIDSRLPAITFDRKRISQVLTNLIGNAVKFTPRGSVRVGAEANETDVSVWVRDTGIGIPGKEQEAIFAEFHQIDGSLARDTQGSGLGLAIARRFVELHGGRIRVESTPGVGSTFTVTLPARRNQ